MKDFSEIREDQIRVINDSERKRSQKALPWILATALILMALAVIFLRQKAHDQQPIMYFEPTEVPEKLSYQQFIGEEDSSSVSHIEIRDITINDIPLKVFIPHEVSFTLEVGKVDTLDRNIIFACQAADIRADNGGIVGAFVLGGKPLAWGLSKKGYCAAIRGKVSIGVEENSALFEEATERGGYFFRQYPLVDKGRIVENAPRGKSFRRSLCMIGEKYFIIQSQSPESFHDFAQALADFGVENAIYLVGSTSFGWAIDEAGEKHEFGNKDVFNSALPENINYLVLRSL